MKIVFLDTETLGKDASLDRISSLGEFQCFSNLNDKEEIIKHCRDAKVLILNKVKIDMGLLEKLDSLKLICVAATGTDNIDLIAANKMGITVKNAIGYSTQSVAQHTFALVLNHYHNLNPFIKYTENGEWMQSSLFTKIYDYEEISEKKWGIIGLGNIGKAVGRIAKSFGAEVCYYSTSGKNLDGEFDHEGLNSLLKTSDIITIHAPLNEKTKNLISGKELSLLKNNSLMINVGRGGIINEEALAQLLESTNQNYFCLDVLEKEPMSSHSPLKKYLKDERLTLTPHVAWASKQARKHLTDQIYQNIKQFFD